MRKGKRATRTLSRRWDRLPVYVLVAALLVLVFVVLSLTVLFHLDTFAVEGETRYTREEVVNATGLTGGENLLRLNTADLEKRILANLPYLEEVDVSVSLPATLRITCADAVPYAYVKKRTACWTVDKTGRVLSETAVPDGTLICLNGIDPPQQTLSQNAAEGNRTYLTFDDDRTKQAFADLTEQLASGDIGSVTHISMNGYLNIAFVVDGRIRVRLGTVVDMPYKMKYVKRLFEEETLVPSGEYALIDASNTERVSVKTNPAAGLTEADILG